MCFVVLEREWEKKLNLHDFMQVLFARYSERSDNNGRSRAPDSYSRSIGNDDKLNIMRAIADHSVV